MVQHWCKCSPVTNVIDRNKLNMLKSLSPKFLVRKMWVLIKSHDSVGLWRNICSPEEVSKYTSGHDQSTREPISLFLVLSFVFCRPAPLARAQFGQSWGEQNCAWNRNLLHGVGYLASTIHAQKLPSMFNSVVDSVLSKFIRTRII